MINKNEESLYLKKVTGPTNKEHLLVCDRLGKVLPGQSAVTVNNSVDSMPTVTVTFNLMGQTLFVADNV